MENQKRKTLDGLTGLRGVAAVSVMLAHYTNTSGWYFGPSVENAAVDIFFVLSAFTLLHVYSERDFSWREYAAARVARIYPIYLVVLAVMLAIYAKFYVGNSWKLFYDASQQALLFSNWPFVGDGTNWNLATWSLSVEWLLYFAMFPVVLALYPIVKRLHPFACILCALALCGLSAYVYSRFYSWIILMISFSPKGTMALLAPSMRGALDFAAGAFAYSAYRSLNDRQINWLGLVGVALAIAIVAIGETRIVWSHLLVVVAPLLVIGAAGSRPIEAVLGSRLAIFFGDISYGIYLIHLPLWILSVPALDSYFGGAGHGVAAYKSSGWFLIPILVVLTTLIAVMSRRYIEAPAGRFIRGISTQRLRSLHTPP